MSFTGSSYGMNLQAYATQYIIEKLGYLTEIIQFKTGSSFKGLTLDLGLLVYLPIREIQRHRSIKTENSSLCDEYHVYNDRLRVEAAQLFRQKRLHNLTAPMTFEELAEYSKKYSAVLIGSDQGWLPGFAFGRRNSLSFVPQGVKRLSYATSLGVASYPWYCFHSSRKVWKRFDSISVREEEGKEIIRRVCGDSVLVDVVLDPTYLISKKEWEQLIPFQRREKERYVLSFVLGNDVRQQECIRRYADTLKLKLVSILSNESSSPIDTTYPDRVIVGASPEDFINLIRGAEVVFTDSFHGIAFSIINKKQLFVFYRKRDDAKGKMSRSSRIDNILRMWDIQDRLIMDPDVNWIDYTPKEVDYQHVSSLIDMLQKKSFDYLTKALP